MAAFVQSDGYVVSAKIISILSVIMISFIIIHHAIKSSKAQPDDTINVRVRIIAFCILCSALIMCTYYVLAIWLIITPFEDSIITESCYSFFLMGSILFAFNKTCIHFSYFLRLQISYKDSVFQVNKYFLGLLYILSALYFISLVFLYSIGNPDHYYWNARYKYCYYEGNYTDDTYHLIIAGMAFLYELIISTVSLILFLRPMFRLKIYTNSDAKLITFKVGLLNSIMIVSSLVALIVFSYTIAGIFVLMDNVINSICVILMFRMHEKLFTKLCCIKFCFAAMGNGTISNGQNEGSRSKEVVDSVTSKSQSGAVLV